MKTLQDWLRFIEAQHPKSIALGLDRASRVYKNLKLSFECPVLTVGGTNGKGSTCAMLEAILGAGGYRTGLYSSPHLLRYNERVRVAGRESTDEILCQSFEAVEQARQGVPLTYFEFGTLSALKIFSDEKIDAAILEVGLGGRLDAVNILDADCAVLTSVGIDHVDYLGADRESIGREKAGIFRKRHAAIVAEPDPPQSVLQSPGEKLFIGKDFGYQSQPGQWSYWGPGGRRGGLAHPALRGDIQLRNAAAALCALDTLRARLPVAAQDLRRGLAEVTLPGRFQVLPGRPQVILDVAHNVQAAATLARNLGGAGFSPDTYAVCGMLADKDIAGVLREMAPRVTHWHVASLPGPRGASADRLAAELEGKSCRRFETPALAFAAARERAGENDKIVAFGSFLTVGEIIAWLSSNKMSMR